MIVDFSKVQYKNFRWLKKKQTDHFLTQNSSFQIESKTGFKNNLYFQECRRYSIPEFHYPVYNKNGESYSYITKRKVRRKKQKTGQKSITVKAAKYVQDFAIAITFSSGKTKLVDFFLYLKNM